MFMRLNLIIMLVRKMYKTDPYRYNYMRFEFVARRAGHKPHIKASPISFLVIKFRYSVRHSVWFKISKKCPRSLGFGKFSVFFQI